MRKEKRHELFHLELLPPIERKPDGSLPRMTGRQRQQAVTLIRKLCSACDKGNCLYLDDGEAKPCPQMLSYSVCCKFFRWVLLKDSAGKELETEIFGKDTAKRCAICGRAFIPGSNRALYCDDCRPIAQRWQKAAYAKRHRTNSRTIDKQNS